MGRTRGRSPFESVPQLSSAGRLKFFKDADGHLLELIAHAWQQLGYRQYSCNTRYTATNYPAACPPPRQRLRSSREVVTGARTVTHTTAFPGARGCRCVIGADLEWPER